MQMDILKVARLKFMWWCRNTSTKGGANGVENDSAHAVAVDDPKIPAEPIKAGL